MRGWTAHRWVVGILLAVVVGSVLFWVRSREHLPERIRIATGETGGLYYSFATFVGDLIEERTGVPVDVVATRGSVQNVEILADCGAELAIVQAAAVPLNDLSVIAPLYPEPVHVVVRRGGELSAVRDLVQHAVSVGPPGSGMRETGSRLLAHYRVDVGELVGNERYFMELETDPSLDGAVVPTGIGNPDLKSLLDSGNFKLLPILDAQAMQMRNPYFFPFTIPRGLWDERPPVPAAPLQTVATTSMLVAQKDCSPLLVQTVLGAIYETNLLPDFPMLFPERDAIARSPVPLHEATREYIDPYGRLSLLASLMEGLAGIKELLFGLVAFLYLTWDAVRRLGARKRARAIQAQKDHLDAYMDRTADIERKQMHETDTAVLEQYLDEVTLIKLQALRELSHEDLRGDRMFLIFLTQCANLIRKIQSKILYNVAQARDLPH